MNEQRIHYGGISGTSFLIIGLAVGLILATTGLFVSSLNVVLLILAGLLFGVFVNAITETLSRYSPFSYRTSYFVVVTLIIVLLVLGFGYLGTQATQRADELWSQLQKSVLQGVEHLRQYRWARQYLSDESSLQDAVTQQGAAVLPQLLTGIQWISWGFTGLLVIFFVGLYAAYDPNLYRTGVVKLFPLSRRERLGEVLDATRSALGRWILGRMMSMVIVGVLTAIGLSIIGVPLPVTLGVIAAFLTFIPNIGPLLAMVPQVLLAMNSGGNTVLYVIVFNIILQGVESYLLTPMIQRHEVSLPPVVTISAQLLMGIVAGVIGIMMAAPIAVVVMLVTQMIYVHDKLGDPKPGQLANDMTSDDSKT